MNEGKTPDPLLISETNKRFLKAIEMKMNLSLKTGNWNRAVVAAFALTLLHSVCGSKVFAQAGDTVDGAVWRFKITPKFPLQEPVFGQYRISNYQIFIKDDPKDKEFTREVGKATPNRRTKVTTVVFKELRVFEKSEKGSRPRISKAVTAGGAKVKMDEVFEWSGLFIDSEGRHWDFKCSRVKE